jgi:hypothetical protein
MKLGQTASSPLPLTPTGNLVKMCSIGGAVCAALIILFIAIQAVTGTILACESRTLYPMSDEIRQAATGSFASIQSIHKIFGELALFPMLFLVAFSIVFSLHVGAVKLNNTKRPWAVTIVSGILAAILIAVISQGVSFGKNLVAKNFWLTPPAGGYPAGTSVAKEQVVSAANFTTFLTIHGIVLPLLAVILIIFVWPSFYEFVPRPRASARNKWASFETKDA